MIVPLPEHLQRGQEFCPHTSGYVIDQQEVGLKDFGGLQYHRSAKTLHLLNAYTEIEWAVYFSGDFNNGGHLDEIYSGGRPKKGSGRASHQQEHV
jgi:hypothetical protein